MYKDKDRQAVREATKRYRARKQGITKESVVIPEHPVPVIPKRAPTVIPNKMERVECKGVGDNDGFYEVKPKPQSYNSMMVGYVPPKPE